MIEAGQMVLTPNGAIQLGVKRFATQMCTAYFCTLRLFTSIAYRSDLR